MKNETLNLKVDSDHSGIRLDMFLSRTLDSTTRSNARKLIDKGNVKVNGNAGKPALKTRAGDYVTVTIEEPVPLEAEPENIPIDIIYEDESLVVVNKAANMVVHPAAGNYTGTLVNALLYHLKDLSGISGVIRPGIVHRLDKGTSGVIVVAKDDETHLSLTAQFKERTVTKRYLALIFGHMKEEEGVIELSIGRDRKNRKKISSFSTGKKEAVTYFKVKRRYGPLSLLELIPKTGRTHQLRVHLSESGHPIVGDELYGGTKRLKTITDTVLRKRLSELDRFLLHAEYLSFLHPKTKERVEFSADIPDDFAGIIDMLNNQI
jgi:23S rRNA pseudouridine1911/1915/1917 synthase